MHTGSDEGWAGYYAATALRPPRPTTLRALKGFAAAPPAADRVALDLGCGTGRDAVAMLERGWSVIAIDSAPEALSGLAARVPAAARAQLEPRLADLREAALPAVDLVNASFVLFLLPEPDFLALWSRIGAALRPSGRFAGHLLGPRDGWVAQGRCWGVDRAALDRLAAGYEVELVEEEEHDGVTPRGEIKHWHVWHLNLRRRPS